MTSPPSGGLTEGNGHQYIRELPKCIFTSGFVDRWLVGQEEEVTVEEVIAELKTIIEVHPEAATAEVWGHSTETGHSFHVRNIGYDRRHKPARIKLED